MENSKVKQVTGSGDADAQENHQECFWVPGIRLDPQQCTLLCLNWLASTSNLVIPSFFSRIELEERDGLFL